MGYKYRNGSTPDHVDSSNSNADSHPGMGIANDTTTRNPDDSVKKSFRQAQASGDTSKVRRMQDKVRVPPTDTVALKNRMNKDIQTMNYNELSGSAAIKSNEPNKFEKSQKLFQKADAAWGPYANKRDTLDQARKGKIPAKP